MNTLTDEQCESLISYDSISWDLVQTVAVFQCSKRMYQVIGSNNNGTQTNYYANNGRPLVNYQQWQPLTNPLKYYEAYAVLAYLMNQLRARRGIGPMVG